MTLPTNSCTYSAQFSPHVGLFFPFATFYKEIEQILITVDVKKQSPSIVSCVTSDSHLRIFDLRLPAPHLTHTIPTFTTPSSIHNPTSSQLPNQPMTDQPAEILTHDWNKYRSTVVATAGVDRLLRTFDLRNPSQPLVGIMSGHQYAVRRITWVTISLLLLSVFF